MRRSIAFSMQNETNLAVMKSADQFLPGRLLHTLEAQRVTIVGVGDKNQSQSFCVPFTSTNSCLLVNNCFVSLASATETLVPRKCLLSTNLST